MIYFIFILLMIYAVILLLRFIFTFTYYKREKDGRMFAYWQEEPATEMQEGGDFSKSDCFYEIKQDIKMKY